MPIKTLVHSKVIQHDGKIALIDWDTSRRCYLGEDLASLIANEADINHMLEYYQRCVPAFYKDFLEYTGTGMWSGSSTQRIMTRKRSLSLSKSMK
jgi:hypothetical protein